MDTLVQDASPDTNNVSINKADFQPLGLVPSATNSAESILAAIIAYAQQYLTQLNFDANTDQSITIDDGFDSIVSRDNGSGTFVSYRQKQFNVNLHKLDATTFSPSDY